MSKKQKHDNVFCRLADIRILKENLKRFLYFRSSSLIFLFCCALFINFFPFPWIKIHFQKVRKNFKYF